ncbi:Fur family transcriptional regulator [Pandoraea horticolens]|nr:transcriptional repressor [Pandoraea horticolens]
MSLTQLQPYLEAARTSLQEQSGRVTSGRVRVLALLLKAGRPLTHQEVLADLATDADPLDRVTAYRVLDWLVAQGWAIKQAGDDRIFRFVMAEHVDPQRATSPRPHTQHGHFRCVRCHRTFCLDDWPQHPQLSERELKRLPKGFVGEQVELLIHGTCAQCAGAPN